MGGPGSGCGGRSRRAFLCASGGSLLGASVLARTARSQQSADDRVQWRFSTNGRGPAAPTVVDGTVYLGGEKRLYALDSADGSERWSYETGDRNYSSPTVAAGHVVLGGDSVSAISLPSRGGSLEERWRVDPEDWWGEFNWATIVDGTVVMRGPKQWDLRLLDGVDGSKYWHSEHGGANIDTWGATVTHDTIVLGLHPHVAAVDPRDGSERWRTKIEGLPEAPPTVADGTVFVATTPGTVHALDFETGEEQWMRTLEDRDDLTRDSYGFYYTPTVADGTVYLGSHLGYVYALDASDGTLRWRVETDEKVNGTLTVANDAVYVATNPLSRGVVHALSTDDGSELWRFETNYSPITAPIVVDGTLYLSARAERDELDTGVVYAIETDGTASSRDSRVLWGTLNHHGEWHHADQSIDDTMNGIPPSIDGVSSEMSGMGVGAGVAGVAGAAWALRSRRSDE